MVVLAAMFGVFSIADAANPTLGNTYLINAGNTISPEEQKWWGPIKEGQLLRIYCKSEGKPLKMVFGPVYWGNNIWRKSGQTPPPIPMLGPCSYCGGKEIPDGGENICESKGGGVVFSANIYGARDIKGPWQWLGAQMWSYDQLGCLNPQKEIGYIPEFYRFDILCYQNNCIRLSSEGVRDQDKMVTLSVAFDTESSDVVQTNVDPVQSYSALAAKFIETINGVKVKENFFWLKALLDSAKLFLVDAKKEPGLNKTASATLQQISIIEQYVNANQPKWTRLKKEQRRAEVGPLYNRLVQTVQSFINGVGKDKLSSAKKEAVFPLQNNQSKQH